MGTLVSVTASYMLLVLHVIGVNPDIMVSPLVIQVVAQLVIVILKEPLETVVRKT